MNRLTKSDPFSKGWRYASALLVLSSGVAVAQQDDEAIEEIQGFTVVGSNIQRLDLEPVSPVINITRESLDATGFSTVGDAIRALPIVSGTSLSTTDAGTSFTPGVSSVNLRGLGNNNTLALLNGRRVAPYPTPGFNGFQSVVDLNSIPSAAIESIQVLKDGASAIYGSDAVAGVISVNLTDSYDGLTTEVFMGNTLDTDTFEKGIFAIGGGSSGKFSIVYTVDYKERNAAYARDIDWTQTADGRPLGGFNQSSSANVSANVYSLDRTLYLRNPSGDPTDPANQLFPTGVASFRGLPLANAQGSLPPGLTPAQIAAGQTAYTLADFEAGAKFYNFQEEAGMFPEQRIYGFYTRMTYAVSPSMDAYLETSMRRAEFDIAAAPTPAFFGNEIGDGPSGQLVVPITNPYNPFGVGLVNARWRMSEVGPRFNQTTADTPRIVAGLKGDLPFGGWNYDTGFMFTKTEVTNLNGGTVFDSRLQAALNGVVIDGDLLYANPFGQNDPRILAYVSGNNPVVDSYEIMSFDFKASGDVLDLGDLGVVKAAFGGESRSEEIASVRTESNRSGDIVGGSQGTSVFGDRDVYSVFAELSIPLTDMAEIQLAGRYEDYSDFGDTFKPKIGAKFKPIEGLLLRAAFGESFRAPDMAFLYSAGSTSFTPSFIPDPLRPNDPPQQIKTLGGGNPALQPEETKSYFIGAVADLGKFVEKLDGLQVNLDLWRFESTSVISRIGAATIVRNAGDPLFAQFITRLPPGPGETAGLISFVSTQWQNLDARDTQGFDFGMSYRLRTENLGEFRFGFDVTYQDKYEYTGSAGTPEESKSEQAGTYLFPQWRGNASIAWRKGDWAASIFFDYVGEFENQYFIFGIGEPNIDSYIRVNPQVSFSGLWDSRFTIGVRNVFNSTPPFDASSTNTRVDGIHNIEPRFVYVRWRKDW